MKNIIVHNACQNNLRNLSLEIPKNRIVVFTGVSGSGKSSLVFETVGAEAQRQINETQNSFIRNRLQHYGIPAVDKIENLNVPIIINQKRLSGNARSTVGTVTDIYAALRLLFSRMGTPFIGYSNIFSFNHPQGMCPVCEGLGFVQSVRVDLLINREKSLNEGAIQFPTFQPGGWRWTRYAYSGYFDNDKKLKDYTGEEWRMLLYAQEHKPPKPFKEWGKTVQYEGLIPRIERSFLKKDSRENTLRKETLSQVITTKPCPACEGKRLNEKVLSCKISGKNIADCTALSIDALLAFIQTLEHSTYDTIIRELYGKLSNLIEIGLQYLTLDRRTDTLSGGESQRIKMVKSLGNSLVNLLYIFDEPSIGLHPKDIQNIINIIQQIKNKGNSVLIVEHDPDIIRTADWIIDIGPGSGKDGGAVVYQGEFDDLRSSDGRTGSYFAQTPRYNSHPRKADEFLEIANATRYNLKGVSVKIPKNIMTVVSGVAGSGKSTLINDILPEFYPGISIIDQGLFAGSIRSNLLTYLDLSDALRRLFAKTNGVSEKLFSTNSQGACPNCRGLGAEKIDLAFMDDIEQPCEVCGGSGFDPEVLKYTYQKKNISEVLQMTVSEAIDFLPKAVFLENLSFLVKLGLDYLSLGQRLNSFSGGERQRLKLTKELRTFHQVIVLDEPSTGLHPSDTEKLLQFFDELIDNGNTLIIIEHNLDIIAQADWIVDMGPGAGKYGGQIIFEGTVPALLENKDSYTAAYLKQHLGK